MRDGWDIGWVPTAGCGGNGEAVASAGGGHPWGQVFADGGVAAKAQLLVATRETGS